VEYEFVQKSGAWFAYGGERIGQGRENAREYLRSHPETSLDIETKIKEKILGIRALKAAEEAEAQEDDAPKKRLSKKDINTEEFDPI
jgi:recombination protein RecA